MSGLPRRLSALEAIAEAARLRPYQRLAAELGCPLEELLAETDREQARIARLRAQGLSVQQILERQAAEHGITVAQLERECEDIERRYF